MFLWTVQWRTERLTCLRLIFEVKLFSIFLTKFIFYFYEQSRKAQPTYHSNHAATEAECRVKEANYKRARKQTVLIISVAGTWKHVNQRKFTILFYGNIICGVKLHQRSAPLQFCPLTVSRQLDSTVKIHCQLLCDSKNWFDVKRSYSVVN